MNTPELIEALAHNLPPVRRLRAPAARAAGWIVIAAAVVALIGIAHGVRTDLGEQIRRPAYLVVLLASLGTGVLAAISAFFVTLPDRSWRWGMLPIPALLLWMGSVGYQCLTHWVTVDAAGVHAGETLRCLATALLVSLPLSLALSLMLRNGAMLRPIAAQLTSGLAVAGFAAAALWLFHPLDASVMVLAWSLATMALALAAAATAARKVYLRPRGQM